MKNRTRKRDRYRGWKSRMQETNNEETEKTGWAEKQ